MTKKITISDVAHEVGVSMMTVSRVINHKDGVSKQTAQRVWNVINRLEYRPSGLARGLASSKTRTLGLVVPDIGNPFFSDIARGLEYNAYAHEYNVFLCNTDEDSQRELAVLRSLDEKRVDGLVLCSSRLNNEELVENLSHFPAVVLVNRDFLDQQGWSVMVDDEQGARTALIHLIQTGHQSIGFLAGPQASASGRKRLMGYRGACQNAGLSLDTGWVRHCQPNVDFARQAAVEMLLDHPELSALFCYNDLVAVGALKAAQTLGRRVPEDLALIGYDDIPLAELISPALTTCRVPRYELGEYAFDLLMAQIGDCVEDCKNIRVQPTLIVRQSAP